MGEAMVGEVGKVAVDLIGEDRGPFAELQEGVPQPRPRFGVFVLPWLGGQGPADHRVVGKFHGSEVDCIRKGTATP